MTKVQTHWQMAAEIVDEIRDIHRRNDAVDFLATILDRYIGAERPITTASGLAALEFLKNRQIAERSGGPVMTAIRETARDFLTESLALNLAHTVISEHENLEDRAPISDDCGECTLGSLPHKRTCAYHQAKAFLARMSELRAGAAATDSSPKDEGRTS